MLVRENFSKDQNVSEMVSILSGMGTNFDTKLVYQLIKERYPVLTETERILMADVVILHTENARNMREILGLQIQVAAQTDEIISMRNTDLAAKSQISIIDPLTGLPNYNHFMNDLLIDRSRSLVLFHINDMFSINNAFGRDTGDMVIGKIGKMLKNYSLEYPIDQVSIYRFNGTTFAVVYHGGVSREQIEKDFDRVKSIQIQDKQNNRSISVSFSAGATLNAANVHSMIHYAEKALKNSGKSNQVEFYDQINSGIYESEELFTMRRLVNEAFEKDLFEVHVQEIRRNPYCITKDKRRKFECLVRMYDSDKKENLIGPARFLPVVKKDGKNTNMTAVVIDKVCRMMIQDDYAYCINLTEEDITLDGSVDKIYNQFVAYGIDPNRVTFEILEDVEDLDLIGIQENVAKLRKRGFNIAIDDFGTGRSNFFRLTKIDVTSIKIDMQYIRGINLPTLEAQGNKSLIKFIIGYAHEQGLTVVAEGIETAEEQLVVETLGADYSQGFFFSKPGPYHSNL